MCRVLSCVVGRGCLLWPVRSLGKIQLAFVLLYFVLQGQIFCYSKYLLASYLMLGKTESVRRRVLEKTWWLDSISSVQFSSDTQSCPTLCNPMHRSTSGLPAHHKLLASTRTHVHWVSDAIQSSHPLLSPSPPAFNLSQHQGLFKWVSSSHQVAKVLEFQLQYQSFQWTPRTDLI